MDNEILTRFYLYYLIILIKSSMHHQERTQTELQTQNRSSATVCTTKSVSNR
jgi:hypothetical protein